MKIKVGQIRAARALLDWSQKDLAARAGVSDMSIMNYESGKRTPHQDTLEKILQAFEIGGVIFTKNGVELKQDSITVIEGENWYLRLLDDVYYSLLDTPKAELIILCGNDKVSPPPVNSLLRKMRRAGIAMRQLVEAGNTYLMGPVTEYRYLPKDRFVNYVSLIYGGKIAVCAEDNTKAIVFKDAVLAQAWRNMFETLWQVLPQPLESLADERF